MMCVLVREKGEQCTGRRARVKFGDVLGFTEMTQICPIYLTVKRLLMNLR